MFLRSEHRFADKNMRQHMVLEHVPIPTDRDMLRYSPPSQHLVAIERPSMKPDVMAALAEVTTATITTILLKKGIRNAYLRGPKPLAPGYPRVVGQAFTLRFIPAREDLATPESWASPRSTRAAIEDMPAGCVCVADARGLTEAGIFGDILVARMKRRGVKALVTDGSLRDVAGVLTCDLPVWCADVAAPSSVAGHTFIGWQEPIGCGGVAVFPGDAIVADQDGAVVIPVALVDEVAKLAPEQERFESWALAEVQKGAALPGLYPANAETKARYEAERKRS
jgi:regulator of RNase E activity RraA